MKCHNVMSTTKLGKSYNLSYTATYITFPPQIVLQRSYYIRCSHTGLPQGSPCGNSLGWGRSGFCSLSCLRSHTDKLPKGKKNLKPGLARNVVVNIEGCHKSYTVSTIFALLINHSDTSIELRKSYEALNFETKTNVQAPLRLKEKQNLAIISRSEVKSTRDYLL